MDSPIQSRYSMRKRARATDDSRDNTTTKRVRNSFSRRVPSPSVRRSSRRRGLLTPASSSLAESQASNVGKAHSNVEEALALGATFPFLELPAELRVHVYRMALQRDEPLLLHLDRAEEKDGCSHDAPDRFEITKSCLEDTPASPESTNTPTTSLIDVALLRSCKLIYKEARQVLYADNTFTLLLPTGIPTLSHLHQRSRSLIKSVALTVPSHHDILDGFADLVRLGLRYCWRLETFTILLDGVFPDDRVLVNAGTSVYATAFHILRFLPRKCEVVLKGEVSEVVRKVVEEEARLLMVLDEVSCTVVSCLCMVLMCA